MYPPKAQLAELTRFLRALVSLAAVSGLLLWGATVVLEQGIIRGNETSGAAKVDRLLSQTHPNEIPLFGSSRVEGGIVPDSLGPHFFNYGLSGVQENVLLLLLEAECRKKKTTPWLIVNYDIDGFNYALGDPANYLLHTREQAVQTLMGEQYQPHFGIPMIKYIGYYEKYINEFEKINTGYYLRNKGFLLPKANPAAGHFDSVVAVRRKTPVEYQHYPELMARTEALIAAHPERKFIYLLMPYHPEYLRVVTDTAASLAAIRAFARRHTNVLLLDFSHLPFSDDYFVDTSHLSAQGAAAFSQLLRQKLQEVGVYPGAKHAAP